MTYRVRNLVIAIGLALVAMMLTLFYVTNYKRSVQRNEADVSVYVASKDVEAGISGSDLIKRGVLRKTEVAKRTVVAGAISSPDQVEKLVLSQPLYAGEQITLRRFDDVAALGVRAQLKGTMRGVQVPGDANQLLLGTLKAGDHVDVVGNIKVSKDDEHVVRIVLRDIPVLQAPSMTEAAKISPNAPASVMVGVTDTQVQRLFYLMKNADWTFQLRPVVDSSDSRERAENFATVVNNGLPQSEVNRLVSGR